MHIELNTIGICTDLTVVISSIDGIEDQKEIFEFMLDCNSTESSFMTWSRAADSHRRVPRRKFDLKKGLLQTVHGHCAACLRSLVSIID